MSSTTIVVAPAEDRTLVSLADLREQLQLKPNDTAQDAWLQKTIARASRQAERYCNRIFVVQSYVDNFGVMTGEPGQPLILAQAPVTVTAIYLDDTTTALDPSSYVVDTLAGLVYFAAEPQQWISTTSLTVSYDGGFDPIPDDVQQAVIELCVIEYRGRARDPMLRMRETPALGREMFWVGPMPGGSTQLPGNIGPLLNPYRRGLIG